MSQSWSNSLIRRNARRSGQQVNQHPRPWAKQAVLCNAQHAKQRVSAACSDAYQTCGGCKDMIFGFAWLMWTYMCAGPSVPLHSSNEACLVEAAGQQAPALAQGTDTKRWKISKSAGDAMPAGAAASCLQSDLGTRHLHHCKLPNSPTVHELSPWKAHVSKQGIEQALSVILRFGLGSCSSTGCSIKNANLHTALLCGIAQYAASCPDHVHRRVPR